jgi:large repetitive protein
LTRRPRLLIHGRDDDKFNAFRCVDAESEAGATSPLLGLLLVGLPNVRKSVRQTDASVLLATFEGAKLGTIRNTTERGSMKRLIRVFGLFALVAAIAAPIALGFGFDDSVKPPGGVVGTPYSFQFVGRAGCPPYEFVLVAGSLPAGLSMSSSGKVTGTPTAAGVSSFWVELRDHGCGPCAPTSCSSPSQRPFSITIATKLTITTGSLAPATVGVPYSVKLASDSGGPQTWSIASGSLPPGLGLAADGTISGTPNAAGASTFVVQTATTDGRKDTKQLALQVFDPLKVTAPAAAPAEVGRPFSAQFTATGGSGTHTWTATGVPDGLTFDPNTATLSGTPTTPGAYTVKVTAADAAASMTQELDMQLKVAAHVTIVSRKLHGAAVGKAYVLKLLALGGVRPLTWRAMSRLPAGLRLAPNLGAIVGKPRRAGTYHFKIRVTDALRAGMTQSFVLKIRG